VLAEPIYVVVKLSGFFSPMAERQALPEKRCAKKGLSLFHQTVQVRESLWILLTVPF
jgi:hypothetical protein